MVYHGHFRDLGSRSKNAVVITHWCTYRSCQMLPVNTALGFPPSLHLLAGHLKDFGAAQCLPGFSMASLQHLATAGRAAANSTSQQEAGLTGCCQNVNWIAIATCHSHGFKRPKSSTGWQETGRWERRGVTCATHCMDSSHTRPATWTSWLKLLLFVLEPQGLSFEVGACDPGAAQIALPALGISPDQPRAFLLTSLRPAGSRGLFWRGFRGSDTTQFCSQVSVISLGAGAMAESFLRDILY